MHRFNRPQEAITAYERAIQLDPLIPVYVNMGHVFYDLENYYEALLAYKQALQLDPFNAEAYLGKGNILREIACEREAYDAYTRAVQIDPLCAPARFWREQMQIRLKIPDKGRWSVVPKQRVMRKRPPSLVPVHTPKRLRFFPALFSFESRAHRAFE